MQRRNFIRLSGFSIAGLLITDFANAGGGRNIILQMPDEITILSENNSYKLTSSDQQLWKYKDVEVMLKKMDDKIEAYIQAAITPVQDIILSWKYASPANTSILGDAWERTYGDIQWQKINETKKLPWYCIVTDNENTACFGVKTGCSAFCSWTIDITTLQLHLDVRNGGNGIQLNGKRFHAADIVTTQNHSNENAFATVRRFCTVMCDSPRLMEKPVYGINDWYYTYGNTSAQKIFDLTSMMAEFIDDPSNLPFSVIDDGWAVKSSLQPDDCCWGDDYAVSNEKFGDMKKVADKIKAIGMRPGLWTRPLTASYRDKKSLLLPSIPGRDDPKSPILDPTIPENAERIKNLWNTYHQWGFEMVKHDYTTYDLFGKWGFQMVGGMTTPGWHFNDASKTNAEIVLDLYSSIREAAGLISLIGCNTISHLSAGLFELNRIGDDTSGREWSRTKKMGVNALGFRMVQHETFYEVDGDCVGLTTAVPWEKNKQWMQLLAESSAPLFISAQPEAIGEEQRKAIKDAFHSAARLQPIAEPLDWLTNERPSKWRLDGQVVNFNWD